MSKKKKKSHLKIAIIGNISSVISNASSAGTEIWTYEYGSYLSSLGHEVTVFCNKESFIPGCKHIQNVSSEIMNKNNYLDYYYENISQIITFIENQENFDIVHISLFTYEIFLAFIDYIKIPICITVHSDFFSQHIFDEINKKRPNIHFCFVSKNQFSKISCSKASVIYNGINCDKFDNFITNREKNKDFIFWIGRICSNKGAKDAIEIALKSKQKLILAGPIEDTSYFNSFIHPYLSKDIEYKGVLSFKEKIQYYENAIATIMPIHWDEPFGLINIESMYCGTPVISYNKGAQREIIENNKTGFIVEENNIFDFIKAIKKSKYIDSHYCKKYVIKNFSITTMTKKYLNIYSTLMEL